MNTLITNIQRYSIHDGGGIRAVIFFKGCPLACAWCHNPETMSYEPETAQYKEREHGAEEHIGKSYTPAELARLVMRDQLFFGVSGGGVTLSGGEPLARDIKYLIELLKILKRNGIEVAVDTSGDVPWEHFEAVLPFADVFLYDIKIATPELHRKYTGHDNIQIINNLEKLAAKAKVWLRIPVIGGVNDGAEMDEIIKLAREKAPGRKVTILPYHAIGFDKWDRIDKTPPPYNFYTPSADRMKEIIAEWEKAGFTVERDN